MKIYLWLFFIILNILTFISSSGFAADGAGESRINKGFRIQIIASETKEEATSAKMEIEQKLFTQNIAVYLTKIDQWYKVRVGDCRDKKNAKKLLSKIKKMGYSDAFIVQTKIN